MTMENELQELCKKKEAEFRSKLVEIIQEVDELMFWMLADKRNLLLAGKLQSANLILTSVWQYKLNGK